MKNKYEIRGEVTALLIKSRKYGNKESLIDTIDLKKADSFPSSWHVNFSKKTKSFYVHGSALLVNGKKTTVCLHRLITNAPDGMCVDHKSHDTLNNMSENLRVCTYSENAQNKKGACKNSKSGIRGVSWSKKAKKWAAAIQIKNKQKHIGYFKKIEDAEKAVKKARKEQMPYSYEAYEARAVNL